MMMSPLVYVLNRIFVRGFYQAHAGMFLFFFLIMVGAVDPGQLIGYHKTLMLAFISSPLMMLLVFGVWLLYNIKCLHYVTGQLFASQQHFMFYSINSYKPRQQLWGWMAVQFYILLPVIIYGVLAAIVGFNYHFFLAPLFVVVYLATLIITGASLYLWFMNRLLEGSNQSWLISWTGNLRKPTYSLFIYQVINQLKIPYLITKFLSWLIVIGIFKLFADVGHDSRVACIAVLAIAVAHSILVFENQRFQQTYLSWQRNFPVSLVKRYAQVLVTYLMLLIPECIWLCSRFHYLQAMQLVLLALSVLLLLHALIYRTGLNMEKYLQWIMGLFMFLFWVIMFKLTAALVIANIAVSFVIFNRLYYNDMPAVKSKNQAEA